VTLHLQLEDADSLWQQAVAAGATVVMPLEDQFWGDRYGVLKDPFGHRWSLGAPVQQQS
jgi:PhnB protein